MSRYFQEVWVKDPSSEDEIRVTVLETNHGWAVVGIYRGEEELAEYPWSVDENEIFSKASSLSRL